MSYCYSCGVELEEEEGVVVAIPRDPKTYEYCDKCFKDIRTNQSKLIRKKGEKTDISLNNRGGEK